MKKLINENYWERWLKAKVIYLKWKNWKSLGKNFIENKALMWNVKKRLKLSKTYQQESKSHETNQCYPIRSEGKKQRKLQLVHTSRRKFLPSPSSNLPKNPTEENKAIISFQRAIK